MLSEAAKRQSSFGNWFSITRRVAAWIALGAAGTLFIVTMVIFFEYPYAYYVPSPPAAPRWMFSWRNWSQIVAVIASLISLPKWQSLVALPATVLLFFFAIITAD